MAFNQIGFIKKFLTFSPREGKNETKAGKYLTGLLEEVKINYSLQKFSLTIPQTVKAELTADAKNISCAALCFASGEIDSKDNILSSLTHTEKNFPFIGFNPYCPGISATGRAIKHPALAIARDDLPIIFKAKKIKGIVKIKPVKHKSQNILAGNLTNPKNLVFTHYDSVYSGAVDNASGVAVTLKLIFDQSKLLKTTQFVLSGNEELCYDFPIYWGRGYRQFEKKYLHLMKQSRKIFIIDCVGNAPTQFLNDPYWVNEGFPVKNVKRLLSKTAMVTGNFPKLMKYYHSPLDTIDKLKKQYLDEAYHLVLKSLS